MKRKIIIYEKDGKVAVKTTGKWTYADMLDTLASLCGRTARGTADHTGLPLHVIHEAIMKIIRNE